MAITVSPTSKAFGSVAAGASSSAQAFGLTPDVTTDSIFSVIITGPDASDFVLTNTKYAVAPAVGQYNYAESTLLTAVDASAFSIVFSPATAGAKTAQAEVHYNGVAAAATLTIALTGTGT